ncbi:putative WD40/YVTN repeat-like-containing domain superfamily [Septoria linicola]|nr:putative WD40/YVTN repeat-like-containing domain superfamily [Septoria linicola]
MSITSEAIWAASPSTTRGQPTILSTDSKGERIVYASNKSIFVRSIDKPEVAKQYTGHTTTTSVARFSPSGFYIASGDIAGHVRVWDSIGAENTKGEYHIIAGRINDIAWDGDSQRIIAVGDGKERFGHCITADSGNSVGEISGHSQQINCVDVRKQRPLRAATGSDDMSMCFFHGAPFKFNTSVRGKHDKFVYGTQFSPDGSSLVTVGSDRRIWIYDGKTGEAVKQIGEGDDTHKGSIFGVSWSPDGKKVVTASGDQTVKVWDVDSGKLVQGWRLGEEGKVSVPDQQVGVVWPHGRSDGLIISVDLEGNLNYFQEGKDKPVRVVRGHQKAITAAAAPNDGKTLWTGSAEGRLRTWDISAGSADPIDGESHSNYVSAIACLPNTGSDDSRIYSVGWDDSLRTIDAAQKSFLGSAVKTEGQPKATTVAVIAGKPHTLVGSTAGITSYVNGEVVGTQKTPSPPTSLAASGSIVAAGSDDKAVRIYDASSPSSFSEIATLKEATSPISALSFSPDGTHLAVGLATGKVFAYSNASGSWTLETNRWSAHTARVTTVAWSHDSKKAVSGALDTNVFVWSLADPGKRIKALNAHKEGVGAVAWIDGSKVISAGADAAVKVWKVAGVS